MSGAVSAAARTEGAAAAGAGAAAGAASASATAAASTPTRARSPFLAALTCRTCPSTPPRGGHLRHVTASRGGEQRTGEEGARDMGGAFCERKRGRGRGAGPRPRRGNQLSAVSVMVAV
ncbi:MAG: hypothetical protein FJW64_02240 [Actinobacteria bacterium]|nr:hypothetical protein [Actinomycetota bacterium]